MDQQKKANWNQANGYFRVSDAGAISATLGEDGDRRPFGTIPPGLAEYILANIDSFRQAVDTAKASKLKHGLSKELSRVVAKLKGMGLSDTAAMEQAAIILKQRVG